MGGVENTPSHLGLHSEGVKRPASTRSPDMDKDTIQLLRFPQTHSVMDTKLMVDLFPQPAPYSLPSPAAWRRGPGPQWDCGV